MNETATVEPTQEQALERVKRAGEARKTALEEYDAAINAARDMKISLRAIAEAAGTTHETIRKISGYTTT